MTKRLGRIFLLGMSLLLLPAALLGQQQQHKPKQHSGGFNVCQGTFANCTQAVCKPVTKNGQITSFSCSCAVQTGYSLGLNGPKNRNSCQSIPQNGPTVKQKVPSRYAPITNFVACTNRRSWAACLDAPCIVDHVDESDPTKATAVCRCPKASGSPYGYVPKDGQYSRSGCESEYISSATTKELLTVTQFLTTPAGKDLPPLPITILVPGH